MVRLSVLTLTLAAHLLSVVAGPAPEAPPVRVEGRFSLPATRAEVFEQDEQLFGTASSAKGSKTASIKVGAK